jgi:hypothetical protein
MLLLAFWTTARGVLLAALQFYCSTTVSRTRERERKTPAPDNTAAVPFGQFF